MSFFYLSLGIQNELIFVKKKEKKIKITFFPEGGLNPRTLDLKFTALTTRPIELTQDVDENDEGK